MTTADKLRPVCIQLWAEMRVSQMGIQMQVWTLSQAGWKLRVWQMPAVCNLLTTCGELFSVWRQQRMPKRPLHRRLLLQHQLCQCL